MNEYVSK